MNECIFCKIINRDIPSYKLYEDDLIFAFLDINPDSNGHILIIPKMHYKDLDDLDINIFKHIVEIAKDLKKELEEKLSIDGLTLIQNNGDIQEVKHFHLHLKPYYKENKELLPVDEIYEKLKK